MANKPYRIIAHRGWNTAFPENSIPAFAAAVAAGADEIEFDVRVSKDGVPVLCHDATLDRTTNLTGRVSDYTAAELKEARIRMPNGELLEGLGIPRLRDVLDMFGGRVGMNIHVKGSGPNFEVLYELKERLAGINRDDVYIATSGRDLEAAKEICPEIPRCGLRNANRREHIVDDAVRNGCVRVQFWRGEYTRDMVQQAKDSGLIPNLFYVDDPEQVHEALEWGIVGILTNDAGPMLRYLRSL